MKDEADQAALIEIYKLHADIAEQAAALREGLNKLYTGMVSSIVVASVLFLRFAPGAETGWVLPGLGVVVAICWMLSLDSMTGRLSAKHAVLVDLESRLPFDFLRRENGEFEKGGFVRRKWSSALMPVFFLLVCLGWLGVVLAPTLSSSAE